MFDTISMTGSGFIVYVLGLALAHWGISMGSEQITGAVTATLQVIGFIGLVIGQLRRKDLIAGMFRRQN